MGIATSQQLTKYYDQYRDTMVTFTKDIIRALRLEEDKIQVKYTINDDVNLRPCFLNSTSFQKANIIVKTNDETFAALAAKEPPLVQLKFSFKQNDGQPMSFFVPAKVTEKKLYAGSNELAVITLVFTQRPPDDLIEIIGRLLEANSNAIRRKEERIAINDDSKRKLNLTSENCIINVDGVPRKCIVRNISFSGANVILSGLARFLENKAAELKLIFEEPDEEIAVKGSIVSVDSLNIEGRKDLFTACINFDENQLPISYKMHVNAYLTTVRKTQLSASEQLAMQKAAQARQMQQGK